MTSQVTRSNEVGKIYERPLANSLEGNSTSLFNFMNTNFWLTLYDAPNNFQKQSLTMMQLSGVFYRSRLNILNERSRISFTRILNVAMKVKPYSYHIQMILK